MFNNIISDVCSSLTELPLMSEVVKFYWHFIASCCSQIQPDPEDLNTLNIYMFVIEKLSSVFKKYCVVKKLKKSLIDEVPQEISNILNANVGDYFKWIINMQRVIIHWNTKFFEGDFNYDDIVMYDDNLPRIMKFANAVCAEDLVCTADQITEIEQNYSKNYALLCSLLVKNSKECGW